MPLRYFEFLITNGQSIMRKPTATRRIIPTVVRPVQLAEVPILLAVIRAAYAEYEGRLTPPSGAHDETAESLTAKLSRGEGALAWQGESAVGSVLFEPRANALYLGRLAVPPLHRRQGIGALLVEYVEQGCKQRLSAAT
jgi:predicted N-acetyltransferase YhbS